MYQWGLLLEPFSRTSVEPFHSSNLTRFAKFHARLGRFALFHHKDSAHYIEVHGSCLTLPRSTPFVFAMAQVYNGLQVHATEGVP